MRFPSEKRILMVTKCHQVSSSANTVIANAKKNQNNLSIQILRHVVTKDNKKLELAKIS